MGNALIAYDDQSPDTIFADGSWEPTLPLSNLGTFNTGHVARSTDLALGTTKFTASLPEGEFVRVLSLISHNMSINARIRLTASNQTNFSSPVVETGWFDVWPVVYPVMSIPWGALNFWSRKYTPREMAILTPTFRYILPATKLARYWLVEIDDRGNADGFVQIGAAFIGDAWQLPTNMLVGSTGLGLTTDTKVQKARSGQKVFDRRTPARTITFTASNLTDDEAMAKAFEIQLRSGLDKPVFFIFDPDDTVHAQRRCFRGTLAELSAIEWPFTGTRMSAAFRIEEAL